MDRKLTPLFAIVLTVVFAAPTAAQAEESRRDVLNDIEATVSGVQASAAIDQRVASDDWMVFELSRQGLVQVDLGGLDQWNPAWSTRCAGTPLVHCLQMASTRSRAPCRSCGRHRCCSRMRPTRCWRLERKRPVPGCATGSATCETTERKDALYEAERARLLDDLDALRQSREFFMTNPPDRDR